MKSEGERIPLLYAAERYRTSRRRAGWCPISVAGLPVLFADSLNVVLRGGPLLAEPALTAKVSGQFHATDNQPANVDEVRPVPIAHFDEVRRSALWANA